MSKRPQDVDVRRAVADTESALESIQKVKSQRPTWEDYVSEGIIDSVPEPGPDGSFNASVNGHERVVKMLQMNEQANRLEAWHADNSAESPRRRERREAREEIKARKFHRPRASIIVPEMPWKRRKREEAE